MFFCTIYGTCCVIHSICNIFSSLLCNKYF
nr:MAG TPA: hypothetical protein [Caudoviricetes sp.]